MADRGYAIHAETKMPHGTILRQRRIARIRNAPLQSAVYFSI